MNPNAKLDHEARVQQMKVQTRQFAATMALELMKVPNYSILDLSEVKPFIAGGKVDHITLLAMAGDIEKYVLGDLEEETKKAIQEAVNKFNAPKIVRP